MRAFDDADQAVSIAAILFFIRAAFYGVPLLGPLISGAGGQLIIPLLLIAGFIVSGYGLLKTLRWAWPLGVAMAGLSVLFHITSVDILSLLFDALLLYLLFRPAVRERFGMLTPQ